jgi:hypothetical protein
VAVPVGGAVINPLNAGGDLRFADFSPMDGLAGVYIEQARLSKASNQSGWRE